jgi:hypothetical protein
MLSTIYTRKYAINTKWGKRARGTSRTTGGTNGTSRKNGTGSNQSTKWTRSPIQLRTVSRSTSTSTSSSRRRTFKANSRHSFDLYSRISSSAAAESNFVEHVVLFGLVCRHLSVCGLVRRVHVGPHAKERNRIERALEFMRLLRTLCCLLCKSICASHLSGSIFPLEFSTCPARLPLHSVHCTLINKQNIWDINLFSSKTVVGLLLKWIPFHPTRLTSTFTTSKILHASSSAVSMCHLFPCALTRLPSFYAIVTPISETREILVELTTFHGKTVESERRHQSADVEGSGKK